MSKILKLQKSVLPAASAIAISVSSCDSNSCHG